MVRKPDQSAVSSESSDDVSVAKGKLPVSHIASHKRRTAVFVVVGLLAFLWAAYFSVLTGQWKFSFTNADYFFAPFSSLGVKISGPLMTDIADDMLPISWVTFHPFHLTLWMPTIGIGTSQGVNVYFSPLNYFYLLPYSVSQLLISMVKVTVAFTTMFFLIRQLGYSARGAFISGMSYGLCAVMVMWNGWPHSEVSMYGPLLILLLDKALKRMKARYYFLLALVLFLMFNAGMPTYVGYFLYFAGAYALIFAIRTFGRDWKHILGYLAAAIGAIACGVLLSAPFLSGLFSTVGSNGYSASRASYAYVQLGWAHLKTLFFPMTAINDGVNPIEGTLYTGILAVTTLPLTFVHRKNKPRSQFFFWTVVVTLLLIFTPVLNFIFGHLPFIDTSIKYRVIVILNVSLAALAGINLDDVLVNGFSSLQERIEALSCVAIGAVALLAMAWRCYEPSVRTNGVELYGWCCIFAAFAIYAVVVCVQCVKFSKEPTRRLVASICTFALAVGVGADLTAFASTRWPLIDKSAPVIPPATSSVKYLERNTGNGARIAPIGNWTFFSSSNLYYGLHAITAHDFVNTNPIYEHYYESLDSTIYTAGSPTRPMILKIGHETLLQYLGVKYLYLSASDANSIANVNCAATKTFNDGMEVCQLPAYSQPVEIADSVQVLKTNDDVVAAMEQSYDPNTVYFSQEEGTPKNLASTAPLAASDSVTHLTTAANGTVSFDVTTSAPRYVLVNDYNDGQWTATVNGKSEKVYRGNSLFRAVRVPAGTSHVVMSYSPRRTEIAFGVAGVTAVLMIAAAIAIGIANRKKRTN